jgi:hypothetical protein
MDMDTTVRIADGAAGIAYLLAEPTVDDDADNWPFIGKQFLGGDGQPAGLEELDAIRADAIDTISEFVRLWPEAPGEALFRHARGAGIHEAASDGWLAIPACHRMAYMIFRDTLVAADREAKAEADRAAAREAADRRQPPNHVDVEETILAQHGHVLEMVGDKPKTVNLGGEDGELVSEAAVEPPAAAEGPAADQQPAGTDAGAGEPTDAVQAADDAGAAAAGDAPAEAPAAAAETEGLTGSDVADNLGELDALDDAAVSLAAARDPDKAAKRGKAKR